MSDIIDELKALEAALETSANPAKDVKEINPINVLKEFNPINEFLSTTEKINSIFQKSAEIDLRLMKLHADFQYEQAKKLAELKKAPATEPPTLSNDN